jgi:hypothetical protein
VIGEFTSKRSMSVSEHRTFNAQRPTLNPRQTGAASGFRRWTLNVECSCRLTVLLFLLVATGLVQAQLTRAPRLDPLNQLMVTQPAIEIASNVVAVSSFDPPVIRAGEKSTYRVTFNALDESIVWPEEIFTPPQLELRQSARGQVFQHADNQLKPYTTINHQVRASSAGSFTISEFTVEVYGRRIRVPAARLEVVDQTAAARPPGQRLVLQLSETNAYAGQPVVARILMPGLVSNLVQGLQSVKLNGEGILVDQSVARQFITPVPLGGHNVPAYVYETVFTPLVAGKLEVSAQGFTIGNRFAGSIIIPGQVTLAGDPSQNVLLDSDAVTLSVRPLPRSGALPGFTGVIGKFTNDPPLLSTNQIRLGESANLVVIFRGEGHLLRFVPPPPPVVRNWQVSDPAPGGVAIGNRPPIPGMVPGNSVAFTYTLTPLTTAVQATPPIPFSYFDPERGAYVGLTVPSLPVTVTPGVTTTLDSESVVETVATESAIEGEAKKLALSALATSPGRVAGSLVPLQQRGWFVGVQLLPVFGFAALWAWDRRRRYLEQHPGILLRRRARRALRRARRELQKAIRAGEELRYANVAVSAMRVACAPHYPAEPRALVCRDVLDSLEESARKSRAGEVVRRFFAVADAASFSATGTEGNGLLALHPELDRVLEKLEARL